MKHLKRGEVRGNDIFFAVLATTERSQVAIMTLEAGEVSGVYGTEHPGSDQILLVVEGEALITVEKVQLHGLVGDTFLIEAGEKHQVSAMGNSRMKCLNFYSPPAYDEGDIEPKPSP